MTYLAKFLVKKELRIKSKDVILICGVTQETICSTDWNPPILHCLMVVSTPVNLHTMLIMQFEVYNGIHLHLPSQSWFPASDWCYTFIVPSQRLCLWNVVSRIIQCLKKMTFALYCLGETGFQNIYVWLEYSLSIIQIAERQICTAYINNISANSTNFNTILCH